ncbi:hypothetical protein [Solimonas marina]|uniref:Uncharacterized protein n=1 Tax=Solimonas marina TaxID=2714601 RepID=A0A969WEJ6_9GAMM|nr:hypothetical protein [Solimonas marina]NKF24799.1 hypothetical protein [Solimonas marina]
MKQPIVERFQITGRGLVVAVASPSVFPAGAQLKATVVNPDGTRHTAEAHKEMILRRMPALNEHEAYLLRGLSKDQVQEGASIEIVKL